MIRFCEVCSKELTKKQKKSCSFDCRCKSQIGKPSKSGTTFKKGQKAWNKGIAPSKETREKWSKIRKGQHNGIKTEFKKGQFVAENHPMWKDDNIGYSGIHMWVKSRLGKAKLCKECGAIDNIQWANISLNYLRDLNDWIALCVKCHSRFDRDRKQTKYVYSGKRMILNI